MFLGVPVLTDNGLRDALVFQHSTDRINRIMGAYDGLGETSESILRKSDSLRRSNSRFADNSTVLRQRIDTDLVSTAISGESGAGRGN